MKKKAEEENKKDDKKEKSRKAKLKETQAPLVTEGVNIMTDWLAMNAAVPTISAR